MNNSAGSARHPRWSGRRDALLARLQRKDVRVRDLLVLYAVAVSIIVIAVAAFFLLLAWIF